ncbi:MAG: hypothetical protein HFG75_12400 [Hungatella sp.]|nr:hypothetical protein [Hungatella sp.]
MEIGEDIRQILGMKVGLTFACMNLKKLAKIKEKWPWDVKPRAALSTI